ncbi:MAG: helix-turn-helix domain-containing protein [Methanomassiliicoccus sp.]|nr:helix-turn-helix domain-containing protein [Methanomassiliicoccus sp.]
MKRLDDLDALLSVIENPARRRILEALVREPHYPLQLSKELGMSQQAVMKHLKVLEAYGLVKSFREESDLGGPMRHRYYPAVNFTIVVDLGTNIFRAQLTTRKHDPALPEGRSEDVAARAGELRERMAAIDGKLMELQRERERLIEEKESIMDEVGRMMADLPDYQMRMAMYEFISRPDLDPEGIVREMSARDEAVMQYIREWLEE